MAVPTTWRQDVDTSGRWVIVAVTLTMVAALAYVSVLASSSRPWLGLAADAGRDTLLVTWVMPAGWAWDAGVRVGDAIVSIDGRPVGPADVGAVASATRVQVRDGLGHLLEAPMRGEGIPDTDPLRWAFLLTAACFLLVGGATYVLAVDRRPARLMLAHAVSGAVLLTVSVGSPSGAAWSIAGSYTSIVSFGASTVMLCLTVPVDRLTTRAGRRIGIAVVLLHGALLGAFVYTFLGNSTAYEVVQRVALGTVSADLVAAMALFVGGVRGMRAQGRRRPQVLGLIALCLMAGCLPFVFLSLLPHIVGIGAIVPPQFAVLTVVLVPASFGIGILSRQVFGIERIVRRGLVALVVWVTLVACYVLSLPLVGKLPLSGMERLLLVIVLTAGTFAYLQSRARAILEGLLFRDTYVYADTVEQIAREIVTLHGVEAITTHVLERLGRVLDLRWAVLTFEPTTASYMWGATREPSEPAAAVPLIADGVLIGSLCVGPKEQDVELQARDQALIRTLAPLVGTALQSAVRETDLERQVQLLHRREEELVALSGRLMHVQEEDRHHLALDLHDDPLQRAILLARDLGEDPHDPRAVRWCGDVHEIIASLRAICAGLRPRVLDDLGLEAGVRWLVNDLRARTELDVSLRVGSPPGQAFGRMCADLEIALFRVVQEALANCLRHAEAERVCVEVCREGSLVRLVVEDDGVGFRVQVPADPTTNLGVLGMRERLRAWGGSVGIEALEPRGTRVVASVELPLVDVRRS